MEDPARPDAQLRPAVRVLHAASRKPNNGRSCSTSTDGTLRDPKEPAYHSSKNNFGPRVAVTWSPNQSGTGFFGGGRTVIRGGFGFYYGPGQTEDQIQPIESDRICSTITSGSSARFSREPSRPSSIISTTTRTTAAISRVRIRQDYTIPERIMQYSASCQQELPLQLVSRLSLTSAARARIFSCEASRIRSCRALRRSANGDEFPDRRRRRSTASTRNRPGHRRQYRSSIRHRECGTIAAANRSPRSITKRAAATTATTRFRRRSRGGFRSGLTMNAQYTYGFSRGNTAGSNEARTSAAARQFRSRPRPQQL